jgi:hypothetical protein
MSLETVSISTSKYITSVKAKIDDHVYTVRKMGAGTQLDLSREISNLMKMRTNLMNLQAKMKKTESEEEADKMLQENMDKMEAFGKVTQRIEAIFIDLFDDGEDGKKSAKLVHALGIDNIQRVYAEIFDKAEGTNDGEK